ARDRVLRVRAVRARGGDVRREACKAAAARAGRDQTHRQGGRGMGESAAETVKEIEEVRGDLEGKVRVLERRLPKAAVLGKRLIGIAVGGGAGSTVFWFAVRRLRKRRAPASKRKPVAQVGNTTIELAVP